MHDWSFKEIEDRLNDPFSRTQASRLTGISLSTLYNWVQWGYLETITKPGDGSTILFTGKSLIEARKRAA